MNEATETTCWEIKGLKYLLLGLAFFLPISISVSEPLAFMAVVLWLYTLRHSWARAQLRGNPLLMPVLLFAMVAVGVSLGFGVRPLLSANKFHRLLFLGLVFVFDAALSRERAVCSLKNLRLVMMAYLAGCTVLGMIDAVRIPLYAWRGGNIFDAGSMRDPQFYMVALCLLASAFLSGLPHKMLWPWLTASFFSLLGIILHFKRGVWLALIGVLALMACMVRRRSLLLVLLAGILIGLAVPQVRVRLANLREVFTPRSGDRYVLWTDTAPTLFREFPLGMGWCAVTQRDFALYSSRPVQPKLNHLHNNLLQVRLELGWAGVVAWCLLMGLGWYRLWRGGRKTNLPGEHWKWMGAGLTCGLSGLLINGMVESNFGDTEIMMLFCLLLGCGAVLHRMRIPEKAADEIKAVTDE